MEISGCYPRIRRNGRLDEHSYGNDAIPTLKARIDPGSGIHPKKKIEGSTPRTRAWMSIDWKGLAKFGYASRCRWNSVGFLEMDAPGAARQE